jgi:drug/metabolite transporter (DMT)-like permease
LEPVLLLFAAGGSIGLIFPFGKLAGELGIPPLVYVGLSAAGASLILVLTSVVLGIRLSLSAAVLRYGMAAGLLTFAIPFGALLAVIPHLGSGIPAILQSLAPILTLTIVYAFRIEEPNGLRALGLAMGLAGAIIILLTRNTGALATPSPAGWYAVAILTPLSLAAGNVYRTTHWPRGQRPLPLAVWTLATAAAAMLAMVPFAYPFNEIASALERGWRLIGLQSLATGIGYAFFFRLQEVGGPVYLSQISYVNTGVGLGFAIIFFDEQLTLWAWIAVILVFAGVALVNRTPARIPGG